MVKYFFDLSTLKSSWDQVVIAFWQRYPNPFSKHVLTEDVVYREVTSDGKLISRRLFTKTNRLPRWAEMIFPSNLARSVFVIEDSVVDLQDKTFATLTWNVNHTRLMIVEEKCVYSINQDNQTWTQVQREAWITSNVFGFSRAIQEFGLARFRRNQIKATQGLEYVITNLQGDLPSRTLIETAKEATGKAKETAIAATEKAKDLASKAAPKKSKQFV
ncbi:PRELI domain containing 1a [Callorhinchus milii]|uniref:PRELI domain-containing protein 1, mitochondrial-like protein n=1 Tax=Callorhinchus milii TaxID=7868 RepID=V9L617_CALMI|nr:PRELI domain containing 1a [Callorhinchus milii]XP_042199033.1 PRELI domain containing 1a [Callorhinchus milii]|eukprot:gi/632988062/ref/XP_007882901.1/ PREDICTED: PRELI domain-containing protein 1, mitochondrial-like [Callorhinchus milii]